MTELKKFGDPDYGLYGYEFCNPAFFNQEPVTNEQYIATIPDEDPWKPVILENAARLDELFPGWKVRQIKEKFGECRFYADAPDGISDPDYEDFRDELIAIEIACNKADWIK